MLATVQSDSDHMTAMLSKRIIVRDNHGVVGVFRYELMKRCWLYSPKHRPSFFDILLDFESEMSDKFRETSFYFNQDVCETASVSDENECEANDDHETDQLTKPSTSRDLSADCSDRSSPSSPKCRRRSPPADGDGSCPRECCSGISAEGENVDSKNPPPISACQLTDRLLANSNGDDTVLPDVACCSGTLRDQWNGGDASDTSAAADSVRHKSALRNGHIPFSFVTSART